MRKFRVVLVEPEHPHNVGFVARAMHCYALDELYIVYPRRDKVIENSYHTAPNSHEVLDKATIVHKFEEAIGDCACAVAFSRRIYGSAIKSDAEHKDKEVCETERPHVDLARERFCGKRERDKLVRPQEAEDERYDDGRRK